MGSPRPADRSRRSRGSAATPKPREPAERHLYKRLLQAGSAAAALGSILALAFTVGDRMLGLFGNAARPHVVQEAVTLERMPYGTYLETKEGQTSFQGYKTKDLDTNVLAVDFPTRFEGSSKGAIYGIQLTVLGRDRKGRTETIAQDKREVALDDSFDSCPCHEFYPLRARDVKYRVIARVLRPNSPRSEPLAQKESAWYPQ
jgi:hypothetical protein